MGKHSTSRPPPSASSRILWSLFFVATSTLQVTQAQTSNATCNQDWDWAINSKGQTPCLVAAYLLAPCGGGQWNVPALLPGQFYSPPYESQANKCQCSTVVYSLLSACGACQVSTAATWSSWRTNCTEAMVSISEYPNNISSGTAVPAWAYLDVVSNDRFDPARAVRAANLPESTVGNTASSTSSTHSTTTTTESSTESSSTSSSSAVTSSTPAEANNSSSNSRSNTGAIVGGTVGGILGLLLIGALILWLLKRDNEKKKHRQPASAEFFHTRPTPDAAAAVGFRSASRHASPLANPLGSGPSSNLGHGSGGGGAGAGMVGYGVGAGGAMRSGSSLGHHSAPSPPQAVFQHGFNGTPWSPPPPSATPSRAMSPISLLSNNMQNPSGGRPSSNDYYPGTSPYTSESFGHQPSISSMHSAVPMMQYAGTPSPYQNAAARHPYAGHGYSGHTRTGSHQSQFSGLPEM